MTKFHFLLILTCMMCMFYISCEESKVQYDLLSESEIKYREIDDCEDCPIEHCCCTIELEEGSNAADLHFCGVYTNESPGSACGPFSAPSPCPSVSGTFSPIGLTPTIDPRKYFCLPFGGTFRIFNNGAEVSLKMTCQANDITDPIYTYFRLDPDEEIFFDENGDCTLVECE